jgi:hypothetical protein
VHGQTADLDLKPDHADIGADQLLVLRFGNQNGKPCIRGDAS